MTAEFPDIATGEVIETNTGEKFKCVGHEDLRPCR